MVDIAYEQMFFEKHVEYSTHIMKILQISSDKL